VTKSSKKSIDPEINRWNDTYPKAPDVQACVKLLKDHHVKGTWVDLVIAQLTHHAADHLEAMIAIFHAETNEWVRVMLLSAIAEASLPPALSLFVANLYSDDAHLRRWALYGLKSLDTKESRTVLWNARDYLHTIEQAL